MSVSLEIHFMMALEPWASKPKLIVNIEYIDMMNSKENLLLEQAKTKKSKTNRKSGKSFWEGAGEICLFK